MGGKETWGVTTCAAAAAAGSTLAAAAEASRGPKRRATEFPARGRGLLAGSYSRSSVGTGASQRVARRRRRAGTPAAGAATGRGPKRRADADVLPGEGAADVLSWRAGWLHRCCGTPRDV